MKVTYRPESSYEWVVHTPFHTTALTSYTKEIHIEGKHKDDLARVRSYEKLRDVLQQPRFIYYDQTHRENGRIRYTDLVALPEYGHLQALVIIVDTDRDPNEVVTWMVKSNLSQEKIDEETIIYDSRSNQK